MKFQMPGLVGRKEEMRSLDNALSQASEGHGSTIILSGEAGIGKSRLIQEFISHASNFSVYSGAATHDIVQPFMLFSSALGDKIDDPLFSNEVHKTFTTVFAVNPAGLLVAQASTDDQEMDGDIFAGMLTAVQSFVRDSMGQGGKSKSGLGRLEYGDLKIIIEHSQHIFVTAVFSGTEHPDMKNAVRRAVDTIEAEHSDMLESWVGMMDQVEPISQLMDGLARAKFLVRRDLEGLKLEEERLRIADRVLGLLDSMASANPVLLVLEDLHWADESSLFTLEYLARNIQGKRIMMLATSRPVEDGQFQRIMEQGGRLLPLIGLENNGLGEMLGEVYPNNNFSAEFTNRIIQQSDGNPFFILELLRQLWEDGKVIEGNGGFHLVEQTIVIPASIEEIVLKRLDNLDPRSMAMAEYSSCIGRSFSRQEAMSIDNVPEPEQAIERLIDSGIIISNNGSVEFSHAIFQDIIYSGLSDRWKSAYHKSIGEYFESAFMGNYSDVIYQLARHFARTREYEKAFKYCIGAGEKAESSFAAEQALAFYTDASKLIGRHRGLEDQVEMETNLFIRLGDLSKFTGQLDNALEYYDIAISKTINRTARADIIRKAAEVHLRRGQYQESIELSESGLELLEGQPSTVAEKLYSTLGWSYIRTGRHELALKNLNRGLEIAVECNDRQGIASAQHDIGSVLLHKGEYESAILYFDRALAIREEINDVWHISSSLNNLGNSNMGLGEMLKALNYYERSVENSRKIGDNRALSISFTNMGNVIACLGDLNKAMDYYAQGYELKVKFDDKWGLSTILENMGTIHFSFGDMEKAQEHYRESMAIREQINDTAGVALSHINIGEAYHYTDRPEDAYRHYCIALEIVTGIDEKWLIIIANYRLSESLLALGRLEEAHEHAKLALDTAIKTRSKSEGARSRQALGNIYAAQGKYDMAIAEFEKAKAIYDETLEKGEQAKVLYDHALLNIKMGQIDTARQNLTLALMLFKEGGGKFFADKCQKKIDEIN